MSNLPLISVIIPCYQAEKTIKKTLADVLNQTYSNIEIITVNDGSTDKTLFALEKFKEKIQILSQNNAGASAARNRGFNRSNGIYILFCDADVRLNKTMVEKMYATLIKNPDKSYCYCNFKFGWHTFDLFPFDGEKLKKENYISTMSLIRRECFIGFNVRLPRYQDWDLWKRMLKKRFEGVWLPERLFTAPLGGGISKNNLISNFKILYRKLKIKFKIHNI